MENGIVTMNVTGGEMLWMDEERDGKPPEEKNNNNSNNNNNSKVPHPETVLENEAFMDRGRTVNFEGSVITGN